MIRVLEATLAGYLGCNLPGTGFPNIDRCQLCIDNGGNRLLLSLPLRRAPALSKVANADPNLNRRHASIKLYIPQLYRGRSDRNRMA